MSEQAGGEPVTCPCKATGVIIDRAHHLDMGANWYIIEHEDGKKHTVEVYWTGKAWRFRMKERQR